MQFTTLALAGLASLASAAQTVHVVTVAMNGTKTYSPNNVTAAVGDVVQFQFAAGNHTVTQSTFDAPCQPISMHSNATGFHSGFQAVTAGASTIPTYSITINNTTPIWVYCAQATHCEGGMGMVINENTKANSSRSLSAYLSLAKQATTVVPGGTATTVGTNGTTTGSGTTSSSSSSTTTTTGTSFGNALSAPSTLGLLALVAGAFML